MTRHTAHDRLLALKLQGANHLARVLETHPDEAVRLKAAMALARLAIPAAKADPADAAESAIDDAAEAATPPTSAASSSAAANPAPARSAPAVLHAASSPPSTSSPRDLSVEAQAAIAERRSPDPPGLSKQELLRDDIEAIAQIQARVRAKLAELGTRTQHHPVGR